MTFSNQELGMCKTQLIAQPATQCLVPGQPGEDLRVGQAIHRGVEPALRHREGFGATQSLPNRRVQMGRTPSRVPVSLTPNKGTQLLRKYIRIDHVLTSAKCDVLFSDFTGAGSWQANLLITVRVCMIVLVGGGLMSGPLLLQMLRKTWQPAALRTHTHTWKQQHAFAGKLNKKNTCQEK